MNNGNGTKGRQSSHFVLHPTRQDNDIVRSDSIVSSPGWFARRPTSRIYAGLNLRMIGTINKYTYRYVGGAVSI